MTDLPKYRLKFTNKWNENFWFVSLGEPWPHRPGFRLIAATARKPEDAAVFDTLPDALAVLVTAGDPPDWVAETLDGRAAE
jgi:hypothetical protein